MTDLPSLIAELNAKADGSKDGDVMREAKTTIELLDKIATAAARLRIELAHAEVPIKRPTFDAAVSALDLAWMEYTKATKATVTYASLAAEEPRPEAENEKLKTELLEVKNASIDESLRVGLENVALAREVATLKERVAELEACGLMAASRADEAEVNLRDVTADNAALAERVKGLETYKDACDSFLAWAKQCEDEQGSTSERSWEDGFDSGHNRAADKMRALIAPASPVVQKVERAEKPERPPMLLAKVDGEWQWIWRYDHAGWEWANFVDTAHSQGLDIDREASDPRAIELYDADLATRTD